MRILVTGHRGYIGSRIYKSLKNLEGIAVGGFTQSPSECPAGLYDSLFTQSCRAFKPDVIIHAGAIRNSCYREPDILFWNTFATNSIIEFCKAARIKLVFLSSCMAGEPTNFYTCLLYTF